MERLCDVLWSYKRARLNYFEKIKEVAKKRGYIKTELKDELIRFGFSVSDIDFVLKEFE